MMQIFFFLFTIYNWKMNTRLYAFFKEFDDSSYPIKRTRVSLLFILVTSCFYVCVDVTVNYHEVRDQYSDNLENLRLFSDKSIHISHQLLSIYLMSMLYYFADTKFIDINLQKQLTSSSSNNLTLNKINLTTSSQTIDVLLYDD